MSDQDSISSKTIAVFDLDGTITDIDTYIHFLVGLLIRNPVRILRASWLPIAVFMHKASLRDNSWLKEVFLRSIAGGMSRPMFEQWCQDFVRKILLNHIRPGAHEVIREHREAGHKLVLMTASFDFYTSHIAQALGFDELIATQAKWSESDTMTGLIDGKNCHGLEKVSRIESYIDNDRRDLVVIAYSDHHSDIPLSKWVDQFIAVNPTGRLRDYASSTGMKVIDWTCDAPQPG